MGNLYVLMNSENTKMCKSLSEKQKKLLRKIYSPQSVGMKQEEIEIDSDKKEIEALISNGCLRVELHTGRNGKLVETVVLTTEAKTEAKII